jgi:type I restriction enzyme R subunit
MSPNTVGQPESATQNRVIALFRDELGYRYLGDWTDRLNNSNIEEGLLTSYLNKSGYSSAQLSRALDRLRTEAGNPNRSLYEIIRDTSRISRRMVTDSDRKTGKCP